MILIFLLGISFASKITLYLLKKAFTVIILFTKIAILTENWQYDAKISRTVITLLKTDYIVCERKIGRMACTRFSIYSGYFSVSYRCRGKEL